ncbi:MAG: hypothetical protein IJE61_05305 [Bacteroidales bacterium]|nr:hypothetical protein [Bacteroidales bacterium]
MDNLEKYIKENREAFDTVPVPDGSLDRLMAKTRRKAVQIRLRWILPAAAAAAVLLLFVTGYHNNDESRQLNRMLEGMASTEVEIMTLVEKSCPHDLDAVENTIRSITSEAIPMYSLLPEELSTKERRKILDEYYGAKLEALDRVKEYYAHEMNNEL